MKMSAHLQLRLRLREALALVKCFFLLGPSAAFYLWSVTHCLKKQGVHISLSDVWLDEEEEEKP